MNDHELDEKLKAAQTPFRPDDYWADFPRSVTAQLRYPPVVSREERRWLPRMAWGLATAAACLIIGFAVGHWRGKTETASSDKLLQNVKLIQETQAMFPNRVRAIVQDERGLNLILSDHADVPDSTPLYVSICDGKQCSTFVTFSGQEVKIAGHNILVLSDARGDVILTGSKFVWSSAEKTDTRNNLKITARALGSMKM